MAIRSVTSSLNQYSRSQRSSVRANNLMLRERLTAPPSFVVVTIKRADRSIAARLDHDAPRRPRRERARRREALHELLLPHHRPVRAPEEEQRREDLVELARRLGVARLLPGREVEIDAPQQLRVVRLVASHDVSSSWSEWPTGRADARTRTGDPFITSEVLYQLSYVGEARSGASIAPSSRRRCRGRCPRAPGGRDGRINSDKNGCNHEQNASLNPKRIMHSIRGRSPQIVISSAGGRIPRSNVQEGTEDKAGALLFVRTFERDGSDRTRVGAGSSPAPTENGSCPLPT